MWNSEECCSHQPACHFADNKAETDKMVRTGNHFHPELMCSDGCGCQSDRVGKTWRLEVFTGS